MGIDIGKNSFHIETADQLDLQALHRVRERLVSQRTGVINHTRACFNEPRWFLSTHGRSSRKSTWPVRQQMIALEILDAPPDLVPVKRSSFRCKVLPRKPRE
jgi:hypothetical protein